MPFVSNTPLLRENVTCRVDKVVSRQRGLRLWNNNLLLLYPCVSTDQGTHGTLPYCVCTVPSLTGRDPVPDDVGEMDMTAARTRRQHDPDPRPRPLLMAGTDDGPKGRRYVSDVLRRTQGTRVC